MDTQPILLTERLLLRRFELCDAKKVQELAGHEKIAETTLNIPHPYKDGMAEAWIDNLHEGLKQDRLITYAIVRKDSNELMGAIGLNLCLMHKKAELAYWIGLNFWNQGFTTEAAKELVKFGFEVVNLNKIYAFCIADNIASVRVMEKAGMLFEGILRQDIFKWGKPKDLRSYSILRHEFENLGL